MPKDREMPDSERAQLAMAPKKDFGLGPNYDPRPKKGGTVLIIDHPFGASLYDRAPVKSG